MFKPEKCPACGKYAWYHDKAKTMYIRNKGVFTAIGFYFPKCKHAHIPML